MNVTVDLAIDNPSWTALGDLQSLAERAAEAALREAGFAAKTGAELSCLFGDDASIRELNARWRGIDKPTNVLSFPATGPGSELLLGDVVLAFETVAREAAFENKAIRDHVVHLIVHGVLHLVGLDHEDDDEADAMEALEIRALHRLGLANPYEPVAAESERSAADRP